MAPVSKTVGTFPTEKWNTWVGIQKITSRLSALERVEKFICEEDEIYYGFACFILSPDELHRFAHYQKKKNSSTNITDA